MTDSWGDLIAATIGGDMSGAALLDEAVMLTRTYVVLQFPEYFDALALWAAATHAQVVFDTAPRLRLGAAEKGCGKTRTLNCVRYMSHIPIATVNISNAALVHSINEDDPPTLIMDEYDTYFGADTNNKHEDLRGLVNSGFERGQNYTRWNMTQRELEILPTFAMAALAGIGRLPDTVEDRAINITLRKREPHEKVKPFRTSKHKKEFEAIGTRFGQWTKAHLAEIRDADPDMPVADRALDVWEPLFKIAAVAGGDWPERCLKACAKICDVQLADEQLTESEELVRDLHIIFRETEADQLHTKEIIQRLVKIEESPWGVRKVSGVGMFSGTTMEHVDQEITDRKIAEIMKSYGVASKKVRSGPENLPRQGYKREHLEPVWRRHCKCGCRSKTNDAQKSDASK